MFGRNKEIIKTIDYDSNLIVSKIIKKISENIRRGWCEWKLGQRQDISGG